MVAIVLTALKLSWLFFRSLAKVNEEWKSKVGSGSTLTGQQWSVKGNDSIAAFVQRRLHFGSIDCMIPSPKQNNLAYANWFP